MSRRVANFLSGFSKTFNTPLCSTFKYKNKRNIWHVWESRNSRSYHGLSRICGTLNSLNTSEKRVTPCVTQLKFSIQGTPDKDSNKSLYERLKLMYKDYWYVLVPVHVATSIVWYGGCYYLVVSGVDIANLLEMLRAPETWVTAVRSSKAGAFVAAYTLYKLISPARYTVTLGGTTISINYLQKWGWIKPIPNKEQLKLIYEEKKCALKDLKMSCQDKMQVTKGEIRDEFIKTKTEMKQQYSEAKVGLQRSVVETKQDFQQGVQEAAREWKHVGGLVKKATTEMLQDNLKKYGTETDELGGKKLK